MKARFRLSLIAGVVLSSSISNLILSAASAAPALGVTASYLQAQGAIIWEVRITQEGTGPLGVELPFTLTNYTPSFSHFVRDSGGDPHNGAAGDTWYYNETSAGSGVLLWNTQQDASDTEQDVGANPFTGTETEGLWIDAAGRRLFAALGSDTNMPDAEPGLAGRQIRTLHIATSDGVLHWNNALIAENNELTALSGSRGSIVARGDMNGNGMRNFQDAAPFGLFLTNRDAYAAMFPGLDGVARADMNGNGVVTFQDATPFGNCLVNPISCLPPPPIAGSGSGGLASSVVPEPANATYFATLFAMLLIAHRRKLGEPSGF